MKMQVCTYFQFPDGNFSKIQHGSISDSGWTNLEDFRKSEYKRFNKPPDSIVNAQACGVWIKQRQPNGGYMIQMIDLFNVDTNDKRIPV